MLPWHRLRYYTCGLCLAFREGPNGKNLENGNSIKSQGYRILKTWIGWVHFYIPLFSWHWLDKLSSLCPHLPRALYSQRTKGKLVSGQRHFGYKKSDHWFCKQIRYDFKLSSDYFRCAKPRGHPVQRKVLVNRSLTILPKFEVLVQFVCSSLPNDRDFFFNATPYSHLTLFSHILNNLTCKILVRNASYQLVLLPHHHWFGTLTEISYDNCFQVSLDPDLAKHPPTTPNHQAGIKVPTLKSGLETWVANEIRVYRELLAIQKNSNLVDKFFFIWKPSDFV